MAASTRGQSYDRIDTHTSAQRSPASVGLAQACPNNLILLDNPCNTVVERSHVTVAYVLLLSAYIRPLQMRL